MIRAKSFTEPDYKLDVKKIIFRVFKINPLFFFFGGGGRLQSRFKLLALVFANVYKLDQLVTDRVRLFCLLDKLRFEKAGSFIIVVG